VNKLSIELMQNQSITGHRRVLSDLRKLLMSLSFTQTALVIRRSSPYTPKHSTVNQQYHMPLPTVLSYMLPTLLQ